LVAEKDIVFFEEPTRATTLGAVVITPNGGIYRCEPEGWRFFAWLH
jgi:hypothetical protein